MRILHRDGGKTMQGGQWQVRRLVDGLRRHGLACGLVAPWAFEPIREFDLTHCHDSRTHTWAPRPLVVTRRVGFPVRRNWWTAWKYARPAAYVAVSRYTAGELMKAGVPAARIHVIPDSVPEIGLADRTSGRVLLLSKNGQTIPGAVSVRDLLEDLRECDVFVYWSDMEGLGSAALVAQAAGVPVVARRVGGLPEAVLYGRLCDELAEVPAAIEAARRIQPEVAEIYRRFSAERVVRDTIDVYRAVLS